MSHQTGILGKKRSDSFLLSRPYAESVFAATEELGQTFSQTYNSESIRMLQIVIENGEASERLIDLTWLHFDKTEAMVLKQSFNVEGDWREDWDKYVNSVRSGSLDGRIAV